MNQFEALNALIALEERGSLTASAEFLNIPKSTLSRRISKLEELLCARLTFEEKGRLSLSKAGLCYVGYARKILNLASESQAALQRFSHEVSGEIKVQLCADLTNGWIVTVLNEFIRSYPQVRLSVNRVGALADLSANNDVLLACGPQPNIEGFRAIELGAWERKLYRGRKQALSCASSADIEQLQQMPWIVKTGDPDTVCLVHKQTAEQYSFQHRARLQVESLSMLTDALVQGYGIGLLPCWVAECERYGRCNELQSCLPDWSVEPLLFSAYVPQHDTSYSIRMFIAFLQQHVPENWALKHQHLA
ncbi:MAG TPA: LysR family transcriptional regulator [Thiopseudomonas sp.]|nr:LysR family transcriptional regulator [Thiopseudomonas sp.]